MVRVIILECAADIVFRYMTMKKILASGLVLVLLSLVADLIVVRIQVGLMERRLGGRDFLERMTSSLKPGMKRFEVEGRIRGFREVNVQSLDGAYLLSYGYWFGFMPPLSKSGFKFVGEVQVTYSSDHRLLEASCWNN